MIHQILFSLWQFFFVPYGPQQILAPILYQQVASSGGTLSFVQNGHCTPSGSSTSCSVTMSVGALTAGNGYVIMGFVKNAAVTVTSMVAGAQTYTAGSTLVLAQGCSDGWYNNNDVPLCYYILPSNGLGGTSPVTINYTTITNTGSRFYITEFAPSANGSQVGLSNDAMQYQPTAATSLSGPTVTTSGTNPFTITGNAPDSGGPSSAAASPYNTNNYFNGNFGFAQAASGSPATWTLTSGTIFTNALVFSYNPTAIVQGFAMNWGGAASGTTLTKTNAAASMQGWQGAQWIDSDNVGTGFVISNTAARTVLSSFGPLNDGTTLVAGTVVNGVEFTSGGTNTDEWSADIANGYATKASLYPAPFSFGSWFSFDNACTGGLDYDIIQLGSFNSAAAGDYLNETVGNTGTCSIAIETNTLVTSLVRNITLQPSNWYWLDYFFDGRQIAVTFSNGSSTITGTNTYSAGQIVNFTTTGGLPTNFATGTDYYVCAGSSSSAFKVATTTGCASPISAGSAGSGTQAAVQSHLIKAYNATSITGASCSSGTTTVTTAGLPTDSNVVNGITVYIENVTPSVWNGTFTGIAVSGNNISYSQTCPGSSYTSGGAIVAQVGSTQDGPAKGASQYWFYTTAIGVRQAITSGDHVWFGYNKMSFGAIDPLLP